MRCRLDVISSVHIGILAHSQAEVLLEVLRRLLELREELVRELSFSAVIFANYSWVKHLPECATMVPPPLPLPHDSEH